MERYDLMGTPTASSEEAGVLRIASEVDEKNCGCKDAAVTPSNLHNVLGCRKANTAYKGNEIIACPYQPGLFLKCVQAGTTSTSTLDTTNVSVGQVITDGGVRWQVIVLPIELGGTGNTIGNAVSANRLNYIPLKNGDDLNNCTDVNSLYSATGNEEVINSPVISTNTAFVLEVMAWGVGNVRFFQRLTLLHYNVPKTFIRGRTGAGGFGEWVEFGEKTGQIIAFPNGVPVGYLPCNGAAVSRTMYCYLFAAIGTTYGSGDGSTTFNLPNIQNGKIVNNDLIQVFPSRDGNSIAINEATGNYCHFYNSEAGGNHMGISPPGIWDGEPLAAGKKSIVVADVSQASVSVVYGIKF